ncbi:ornithine carbamoyltransferase [Oscillospiraceae bacterium OttesenSCG-928-G22]|nr:ornithine carbamoyltransferase [Oscillospiraceae bacterium OttesenSCG-928-G22]
MEHLLKLSDLSGGEILALLDLADRLKRDRANGVELPLLRGKTLAMLFEKASTRTRVSFECAMAGLGGHAVVLNASETQLGRGEPEEDTARVLGRYCDAIMLRTFSQKTVETFAFFAGVPVINGLTDEAHPCQALADLMTIREVKGCLAGRKLAFVGDGNNVASSLVAGALACGMSVSFAAPKGYAPPADVLAFAAKEYPGKFRLTDNVREAAENADVLATDVFASMGQEGERNERLAAFSGYQLNEKTLSFAKPDAMVQHCLPAHRGEEITADVFEAHADEIFAEAENRMHAQKAVLLSLLDGEAANRLRASARLFPKKQVG